MPGNDRHHVAASESVGKPLDERLVPLLGESRSERRNGPVDRTAVRDRGSVALDGAIGDGDGTIADAVGTIDDGLVTHSLDALLLSMIASSDHGAHGTELMEELDTQFDVQLSPGTVYPRLHKLDADGVLGMHELVQTKQYSIDDRAPAQTMIERTAHQHLSMGVFLLDSLDAL